MSESYNDFKYESLQDTKTIVKYLEALKKGFESGKITFANSEKKIHLNPLGIIKMEVRFKRKDDTDKISIKCSWKNKKDDKKTADILKIE
jgi:amphi-Trp domain-containing protein